MVEYHGNIDKWSELVHDLHQTDNQDSRIGGTKEILNVSLHADNPRERFLFRPKFNLAFALQECFAYWHGDNPGHVQRYNSKMEKYINDDGIMPGSAYGDKFRHKPHDQISRVIDQLRENPASRRAVVNIHNASYEEYDGNDVSCTIYLQFMIRNDQLHLTVNLRSQDVLFGLNYDFQAFAWMQEVMAGVLDVELGDMRYIMNSMHYYTAWKEEVLEAANVATSYETPDCRLDEDELSTVMGQMTQRLNFIRKGRLVQINDIPEYYANWLLTMQSYEQARFHDDPKNARVSAEQITFEPWKNWCIDQYEKRYGEKADSKN